MSYVILKLLLQLIFTINSSRNQEKINSYYKRDKGSFIGSSQKILQMKRTKGFSIDKFSLYSQIK